MQCHARTLGALVLVLLAACRVSPDEQPPQQPDAPAGVAGDAAVCLQGEPFIGSGTLPVSGSDDASPATDAGQVAALRWQAHDGCERFVIDIARAAGGDATDPGRVEAELIRELGIVRVTLRSMDAVDPGATDATFDGPLAARAYTVRSPDGQWLFVDLHLAAPAEAHVAVLREPARVVVDLRPGGPPLTAHPAIEQRVVVLRPAPGPVTYPFEVTGYARTFEANVVARLERDGMEVSEQFTTATSWVDTWGHFTLTIERGPDGPLTLHVGEYSARDGTWEGVRLELNGSR